MSAAAARRRKQLASRKEQDAIGSQLSQMLGVEDPSVGMSEETAYEAQQLAQSQIRKKINAGASKEACDLAFTSCLTILQKGRVSVASQLRPSGWIVSLNCKMLIPRPWNRPLSS
jgi:hypothetical protein